MLGVQRAQEGEGGEEELLQVARVGAEAEAGGEGGGGHQPRARTHPQLRRHQHHRLHQAGHCIIIRLTSHQTWLPYMQFSLIYFIFTALYFYGLWRFIPISFGAKML